MYESDGPPPMVAALQDGPEMIAEILASSRMITRGLKK
jgi:hypothetical protein